MSTTDSAGGSTPADGAGALALGVLAEAGPLGHLLLHGEPLAAHALRRLRDARVEVLAADTPWASVVARDLPLVVHDPACPMTPAPFISVMVDQARLADRVLVAVRPVTDTVKTVDSGRVGETVDRDSLLMVTSPIVLPASVVAAVDDLPDLSDSAALVGRLRIEHLVDFVPAPTLGRRVEDESAVLLLEAFEELNP